MSNIQLNLKPFSTPNFVSVELGTQTGLTFALHELEPDALSRLCDDFRAEIFQKAGKIDPSIGGKQ